MVYQTRKYSQFRFSPDYKHEAFLIWYRSQRPNADNLYSIVPYNIDNHKPESSTLARWIREEFKIEADRLDKLVQEQIDNQLVLEKVEMVTRHAATAKEMQDKAITYLRTHEDQMSAAVAVRLYVEGVRIERESRGLPGLITEISKDTNEELLKRVKDIFTSAPMLEEPND